MTMRSTLQEHEHSAQQRCLPCGPQRPTTTCSGTEAAGKQLASPTCGAWEQLFLQVFVEGGVCRQLPPPPHARAQGGHVCPRCIREVAGAQPGRRERVGCRGLRRGGGERVGGAGCK